MTQTYFRFLKVAGLCCLILFGLSSFAWAGELSMTGRSFPPTIDAPLKFTGAGSCNQAKCHGHKSKKRANEYTTWIKAEVHSQGYSVLFEKDSQKIAKDFGLKGKPEKSKECTVCHTLDLEAKADLKGEKYDINEGVTCELCHGPAQNYLEPHAKPYGPKGVTFTGDELWAKRLERHAQSVTQGMWDAKDPRVRLETCLFCHYQIGGKMIKAGHPELDFEMGYFQKTMPVHWEEVPNKGDGFPAKMMAAGQAIALREALRNLAKAAKDKAGDDILKGNLEQAQSHGNMLRVLSGAGIGDSKAIQAGLKDLAGSPGDASKAEALASKADGLVGSLLNAKYNAGHITKIMKAVAGDGHLTSTPSNADAKQAFMVIDSLFSGTDESMLAAIDELYFSLFAEEKGQEPPPFDAKKFGQDLAKVGSLVK